MTVFFEDLEVGFIEISDSIEANRDDMVAYARTNDPYPIHVDHEVARRTPFGDVIASFGYTVSLYMQLMHRLPLVRATQTGFLGAVSWEVTFGGPIRPGDQIRLRQTIVDKRLTSRRSRGLVTSRNELLNQHDEIPVSIDARWLLATGPTA